MESTTPVAVALGEWVQLCMRRAMRHLLHYTRRSGLSSSQVSALLHIHSRGVCGVTSVGGDLGVSSAAASLMLERLVRQGLVERNENPDDRRAKQIVLTEKGREVLHESICAHQEWLDGLAHLMTPQEQAQVLAALTILIQKTTLLETDAAAPLVAPRQG